MNNGRVCSIHNEWCADGSCRWCEPLHDPVVEAIVYGDGVQGVHATVHRPFGATQNTNATASGFPMTGWYTVGE